MLITHQPKPAVTSLTQTGPSLSLHEIQQVLVSKVIPLVSFVLREKIARDIYASDQVSSPEDIQLQSRGTEAIRNELAKFISV